MVSATSRIHNRIAAWMTVTFLSVCLAGFRPVSAQEMESAISGTITSASGSRVPGALVSAKSTKRGEVKTVIASADGTYKLNSVRSGTFEVTASAPGFTVATATVTVTKHSSLVINLVLQEEASVGW